MKSFQIPQKVDPTAGGKPDPTPFRDIPNLMILSSDEEELKPVARVPSPEVYVPVLEQVKIPESEIHKKGKMMAIVMETFERRMREDAEEKAEIARNPVVRKTDPKLVRELEELKKQFPTHNYLPIEALRQLHAEFKKVATCCVVERDPNKHDPIFSGRQRMRQKLTCAVRLALAELKYKVNAEEYTDFERELTKPNADLLKTAFIFASEIESVIHKRQFLQTDRSSTRAYDAQMVLVSTQLKDALNMEFHRLVLNRTYDLKKLAKISENELMSAKAKELEQRRIEQFVREHEIQHHPPPVVDEPIITYGSDPPRYYERMEEEKKQKEKEKREEKPVVSPGALQLEKTKKIAKTTYHNIVNSFEGMSKRVAQVKEDHAGKHLVRNLNDFPSSI